MDPRHIEQELADAHELLNQASMARQAYNGLDGLPRVLRHTAGHSPTGVHPTPGTPRKPAVQGELHCSEPSHASRTQRGDGAPFTHERVLRRAKGADQASEGRLLSLPVAAACVRSVRRALGPGRSDGA